MVCWGVKHRKWSLNGYLVNDYGEVGRNQVSYTVPWVLCWEVWNLVIIFYTKEAMKKSVLDLPGAPNRVPWSWEVRETTGVKMVWNAENMIWHTGVRNEEQRANLGDRVKEELKNLANKRFESYLGFFFFLEFAWN